ncbi:MBL fold metallo-hydrolase [Clostridium bowmanii]|uniref:ComEC/Rec2 family competence protein n=1 Tax=Clostridium bowmanii TaxID=132925 RepID=UPI001CD23ABF|nr:ComEC/Rec2 family competence protein [Clostridium bowmanii]MCA1073334.1 MBL fold metallo-hydrolase [Clostridium bowmanii]
MFMFLGIISVLAFLVFTGMSIKSIFRPKLRNKKLYVALPLTFIMFCTFAFLDGGNDKTVNTTNKQVASKVEEKKAAILPVVAKPTTVKKEATLALGELKVHYIDVGQADSILVQQGTQNMLIDAGNNADDKLVVDYLNKQGVKKIDVLIGTHTDEDHIGGLDTVIKTFDIGKIYMPKAVSTTDTFKDVILAIKAKNMKISVPKVGEIFKIGNSECTIIAPNALTYGNDNNYSIITKLKFGNKSFIFMGDAEDISEGQILAKQLDISADVIKIGHHGSDTSTTQEFLDAVNPKYAVISVGKGNSYGHPTQLVMDRLKAKNIEVYRTDENGTVIATSNGEDISFNVKPASYNGFEEKVAVKNEATVVSKSVVVVVPKTVVKPTPKPSVKPKQTNSSVMVWLSATGTKYHSINNCGRMNPDNARQITLEEAKSGGYSPCSKCSPPQ